MQSILKLDPTRVGPRDAFTLTLTDNSLDFTVVGSSIQWFLLNPTGSSGALYPRVPSATVIDAITMSLMIDSVGPHLVTQVPIGTYLVVGRLGFWEGNSHQHLQVLAQSQTQPPPSPPTITSVITRGFSQFQMFSATIRWRFTAFWSRLTFAINILRQRMGLLGPLLQAAPPMPLPTPDSQILPLVDGEKVFPEVANLISESEHFCYISTWGFDEDVRFNNSGQSDAPDAATLLRAQAVALARRAESRVTGRAVARAYGDVRVLVWDATADDDFSGNGNNIGTLGTVIVPWRDVRQMKGNQAAAHLRDQGLSGETRNLLAAIHNLFRQLGNPPHSLPYPSGVLATSQNHPSASIKGSHHQKFCVSERNAYVGGLNFHRQYWDRNVHAFNEAGRGSSHNLGSGGSGEGPLHDCGAILADAYAQRRIRQIFALRWDDAINIRGPLDTGAFEGYIRKLRSYRAVADSDDEWVYTRIINTLSQTPRTLIGQPSMRVPMVPHPVGATVDHLWVNLTLPPGMPGFNRYGEKEILAAYGQIIDWLGPPSSVGFIESQYFDHKELAENLLTSWQYRNPGREDPMVHIVIPYKPDTHWADRWLNYLSVDLATAEWERIVRHEFRHLRWCEIQSMQELLEPNAAGEWVKAYEVRADTTISIGATIDTLEPDTVVTFTNLYNVNGARIASLTREVQEFMTRSQIVVYTLAMEDAPAPTGGNPEENQRDFLENHGIYVHSKTAILIDTDKTHHTSATTGSANLTPRSLDAKERDSELNVWWRQPDRVQKFFETLVKEHTGGPTDSYSIQEAGLEALNRIRTGNRPGRHLVRLDLCDRKLHLD